MLKHHEGKVALITGAASGIGRSVAEHFSRSGASVVVADISSERAESIAHDLSRSGATAIAIKANITIEDEVEKLVASTVDHFGRLDAAANVAGISQEGGLFCDKSVRDAVIATNLFGVFYCVAAEAKVMQKAGGGAIVNCASIVGLEGAADTPYYAAAKIGVIGFTRSVALELAPFKVRVNAFCPGLTRSGMSERLLGDAVDSAAAMIPLGRVGEPADQARAAVWLCSDESSFITGTTLAVDGGQSAGMWSMPLWPETQTGN